MKLTQKQKKAAEKFIKCMKDSKFDYNTFTPEDILYSRNLLAEDGVELTPKETEEMIKLMALTQTKMKKP